MVSKHIYGLVTCCLHGSPLPATDGLHLDISQPPQGSGIGGPCYRYPTHGHPLRGWLVDKLDRTRVGVHRLHDAALGGSPVVLRFPPQERPPLRCCASTRRLRLASRHNVLASVPVFGIIVQMVFAQATEVCSATPTGMDSSCSTTCTIRNVRYGTIGL